MAKRTPLKQSEKDEIVELLKKCEEPEVADRLTDWERNYLADITEQYANVEWLSPDKQIPKLKQIVAGENGPREARSGSSSRREGFSGRRYEGHRPSGGGFSGFNRSSEED